MTYERFLKITLSLQKESRRLDDLNKLGVNLNDFVDPYHSMVDELMKEVYGDEGWEWWSWFCWESDFGQKDWSKGKTYKINEDGTSQLVHNEGELRYGAYDKEGNPICYSYESTWEYLERGIS